MGFKWQDDITIDEHESYNDIYIYIYIYITMDTLSLDITKEQEYIHIMDNQYIYWHMLITPIIMIGRL